MQKIIRNNMSRLVCGKNSVLDAINNNLKISKIYTLKFFNIENPKFDKSKIEIVSKEFLDELTRENHQGIVAIIENNFQYCNLEKIIKDKPQIILMLDHIEDPHNLGAILRTANAAGVKHIIIPDKRSADINETVLKVSSGGFINMNIAKVPSLQPVVEKLKSQNYWIYASAINEKAQDYSKVQYNAPLVLIVGNEAKGVSNTLLKASDQLIYINMFGTVQSLNVSVATGILLFEIVKSIK